uniref:BLOC-1-related complex subunit 6 C-terminal helix domain-containing protein n=1 Tax=Kalanchoe fedtschenkoi TaxID=63787 RepID=A0A7N0U128_KALFE
MAEAGEDASRRASEASRGSTDVVAMDSLSEGSVEPEQQRLPPPLNLIELFKAIEVVERDSVAIAESFTSLFASLRLALAEVSGSSVEHMQCFSDAAGRLQESALDASTRGNRYINSCLRLNEELKGADNLAAQLKYLRKTVDTLDSAVNRLLRLP